ncbi:GFA family protein [Devosia sp. A8/3-2]|nr:GFA family protein [Devosia sp. A8/3-2]
MPQGAGHASFCGMSKPDRLMVDVTAACACGAVEMTLRGRVLSMLVCSCPDCQRATGTGHSTVALAPAEAVTVNGTTANFARPADSGAIFTRHFCPTCGTPLYGQSSRAPDLHMIPVGFFAGQNQWFDPTQLIFARSQQARDSVADHLPVHQTYRERDATR